MRIGVGIFAALLALGGCTNASTGLLASIAASAKGTPQPARGSVDMALGHRFMATGEYEQALSAYTRAAGKLGLNVDVLSGLGSANLKLGRFRQAKTLLEAAVKKDPKFVPAWNNLGVVYMEMGRAGEARRIFRNAYALDNGNSNEIRNNLRLAIAKTKKAAYVAPKENKFELIERGDGRYLLLPTPGTNSEQ